MNEILKPKTYIKHLDIKDFNPPKLCIICFNKHWEQALQSIAETSQKGPLGLKYISDSIAFIQAPMGTSAASVTLEELSALGIKQFISFGSAGSLKLKNSHLKVGDCVVGKKAICDDAVSVHYNFELNSIIENNSPLLKKWQTKYQWQEVCSWTTAAPYRETEEKFIFMTEQGASIVDMEMASILAVSKFRGFDVLNLFVISDILEKTLWLPAYRSKDFRAGREFALNALKQFLLPL